MPGTSSVRRRFDPGGLLVSAALVGLLGLLECGPLTVPPNPDRFNTCTGEGTAPCAGYCPGNSELCAPPAGKPTCQATKAGSRACLMGSPTFPFVLVVDVPVGAPYGAGQTFVLTDGTISAVQQQAQTGTCSPSGAPVPCCLSKDPRCIPLPELTTAPHEPGLAQNVSGAYVASTVFLRDLQPSDIESCELCPKLGLSSSTPQVSLPLQSTLTPEWMLTSTSKPFPAALVGLPLPVIEGVIVSPFPFDSSLPASAFGTMSVGWETFAFEPGQLLPSELAYSQALEVLSPYEVIPPVIDPPALDDPFEPPAGLMPVPTSVCVTFPQKYATEGWTVFFREAYAQRVLSSIATLGSKASPAKSGCMGPAGTKGFAVTVYSYPPAVPLTVNTITTEPAPPFVVVAPPAGSVIPTLIENFTMGLNEAIPPLPPSVTLRGQVSQAGTPTSAKLHFVSQSVDFLTGSSCAPSTNLYYETVVVTDRSNVGEYSVTLPRGDYTVTINPDSSAVAPQASIPMTMPLADCGKAASMTRDFDTGNAIGVSGTVVLPGGADGGVPVPSAFVDLTPSLPSISVDPPAIPASPIDQPRPFEVMTDPQGNFSFSPAVQAAVGPGLYDITVRPPEGTFLPWVVSLGHQISTLAGSKRCFAFTVPAPTPVTLTLHDPTDQPVVEALVRAYAFPPCAALPCSGAVQIGQELTDATGAFQMFLAPSPFGASVNCAP